MISSAGRLANRRRRRHGGSLRVGPRLGQIHLARGGIVEDAAVFALKPETHNRHEVGMANAFDQLQGPELLASFSAAKTNDLQRRLGSAGRAGLPDFAEAPAAQKFAPAGSRNPGPAHLQWHRLA